MPFKIMELSTGLYSMGGTGPTWASKGKKGKLWTTLGHVRNHLNQRPKYDLSDTVVIEVELVEVSRRRLGELVEDQRRSRQEKEAAQQAASQREEREREERELARLAAKLGKKVT